MLCNSVGIFLLSSVVWAQVIPETNPSEVWVKGQRIKHWWSDGKIFVSASDLESLLGTTSELSEIDLLQALQAKGGYSWSLDRGKLVAEGSKPRAIRFDPAKARANNAENTRRTNEALQRAKEEDQARPSPQGYLIYTVETEQVDHELYYIHILVKNDSSVVSHEHKATYYIPADYHSRGSDIDHIIPPLDPGQIHFLRPIPFEHDKPPSKYLINMNFFNLVNERDDPRSKWDKRRQARERKKSRGQFR